jgi:hypothetical protein
MPHSSQFANSINLCVHTFEWAGWRKNAIRLYNTLI